MITNRHRLIRFAEYAAVSASLVGAVATLITQRPAYAVAPLSAAAGLSLLSRREQRQHSKSEIEQHIEAYRAAQATQTKLVQELSQAQIDQTQQLRAQIDQVDQRHTAIQQQIDSLNQHSAANQPQIEATTQQLDQQRATLANATAQIKRVFEQLSAQAKQLSAQAKQLSMMAHVQSQQNDDIAQMRSHLSQQAETFDQQSALIEQQHEQQHKQQQKLERALQSAAQQLQSRYQALRDEFESKAEPFTAALQQTNEEVVLLKRQTENIQTLRSDLDALEKALQGEREAIIRLQQLFDELAELPNDEDDTDKFNPADLTLPAGDDFDLDINLGIDFGTGYTKVCFRDLARDRSEVVTFSSRDTDVSLEETLIPTRLALLQDGTLLSGLTVAEWQQCDQAIDKEINYIKMRLAAIDNQPSETMDEWRLEQIPELDDDETVESLCAYYLSKIIKRSQAWILQNRPELFENQTVRWSANIGVPVEYCDSPALGRFERVLGVAWLIVHANLDTTALTIDKLNALVSQLQQWKSNNPTALDCTTTPEIAAAVWSFLNSRQAQEGFYTFFDIGDGTLDGAAFIFRQDSGGRQVDFYTGRVKPLGVTAFVEKTAEELSVSPDAVRLSLSKTENETVRQKMQQSSTRKAVQRMVADVVVTGRDKHKEIRQHSVGQDTGDTLRVFVGGGGGNTQFFPDTIQATHAEFGQSSADVPPYEIRRIPAPDDLSINGLDDREFNRFAIAYGLCIPEGEGPIVQLPSQFDTIEQVTELTTGHIDRYEDSRDAT